MSDEGSAPGQARPARAGDAPRRIYAQGYEACAAAHLGTAAGTLVSRVTHGAASALSLTRALPADAFGVAVALDAHDAELRHGDEVVRSGRIPMGNVNFQRPGQITRTATAGRWDVLFFYLPRATIARVCAASDADVDPKGLEFRDPIAAADGPMLGFARRVRDELRGTDAFARLRVELIAQDLVIHVIRHHSSAAGALRTGRAGMARGGLAPGQLRRAFEAMDAMPERDVTLAALAAAAGCSAAHFGRAFRQSTGLAPFAWLLHRRVERAKRLLRAGDLPTAEVALAVGFSAQPQFTTAFKRVTGLTPAAWRRQAR